MPSTIVSRRLLLTGGLAATVAIAARPAGAALQAIGEKTLHLYHCRTGEWYSETYWAHGEYLPEALQQVNRLMRDHHNGRETAIDPALLDLLHAMERELKTGKPIEILSAYRSPETNHALRRKGIGAATNSLHLDGRAADIRLQGVGLKTMRQVALASRAGGVGYYPDRQFLHVDTGPARQWSKGRG